VHDNQGIDNGDEQRVIISIAMQKSDGLVSRKRERLDAIGEAADASCKRAKPQIHRSKCKPDGSQGYEGALCLGHRIVLSVGTSEQFERRLDPAIHEIVSTKQVPGSLDSVGVLLWLFSAGNTGCSDDAPIRLQVWNDRWPFPPWCGDVSFLASRADRRILVFLFALFVIASGLSFLETTSNPFIAQLGDPKSAARRLNFSQAFNPVGAITGVLVGTVFIFSGVELAPTQVAAMQAAHNYGRYLRDETLRVVDPYLMIGALAFFLTVLIWHCRFPAVTTESMDNLSGDSSFRDLLRYPHFVTAICAQFMYVGALVGTWSYFIQYVEDYTHNPEKIAGYFLTGTLFAFGIGRFASSAIIGRISAARLMGLYSVINVALLTIGVLTPGWAGLWTIFLSSFFMSVMYPTIFAL
jgi:hypothetical protein